MKRRPPRFRNVRSSAFRSSVSAVTTLLDEGEALVVRCDSCRRLWPITRDWLERSAWIVDGDRDLHTCPVCMPKRLEVHARDVV